MIHTIMRTKSILKINSGNVADSTLYLKRISEMNNLKNSHKSSHVKK